MAVMETMSTKSGLAQSHPPKLGLVGARGVACISLHSSVNELVQRTICAIVYLSWSLPSHLSG